MHSDILDETGLEKATRKWLWYALIPVILFIGVVVVGILIKDNNININLKPDPPKGRVMGNTIFCLPNTNFHRVPADGEWYEVYISRKSRNLIVKVDESAEFTIETKPKFGHTRVIQLTGAQVLALQRSVGYEQFWYFVKDKEGKKLSAGHNPLRGKFDVRVTKGLVQFKNEY